MSIDGMILYTTVVGVVRTEKLRSKQLDLREEVKNKILEEGIYHITSKEAAEKIVESGYILPSKGVLNNHFSKSRYGDKFADFAYMFAGRPTAESYNSNMAHKIFKDGTIYAVKHTPDKFELSNYTERLEDGAITYEGRCDIANSKPELVRMKFEKGQLIEIPWNEQVQISNIDKLRENFVVKISKEIITTCKKIGKNAYFIDKDRKLQKCKKKRREEKKILKKYNNHNQRKQFEINKDGVTYILSTIGTKINDGKILTGYRVEQVDTEFAKNIFMDATDVTEITEENLKKFLGDHMNETSIRSEYIGKPTSDGERIIDEEYAHHFYEKQLMVVKNDETYAKYVEEENAKKNSQLKKLGKTFLTTTAKGRSEAAEFIKNVKEKGLNIAKDFIRDESTGFVLGE